MSEGRHPKVLSCASCRQRKIKCDKVQPVCTQCSRASTECVFPSRKPTRRVPRPRQSELLERISRLENIVGQANPEKLQELDELTGPLTGSTSASASARGKQKGKPSPASASNPPPPAAAAAAPATAPGPIRAPRTSSNTPNAGREERVTPSDSSKTSSQQPNVRYLSDEFWGNLCDEVEGIKQALEETSSDDQDDEDGEDQAGVSPEAYMGFAGAESLATSSSFTFGNPNSYGHHPQHPAPEMILRLWGLFVRNVDPLIKLIHRPTLNQEIQNFVASSAQFQLPASTNALFFAIYYAAVLCLTDEDCLYRLGEHRSALSDQLRMKTEQALAAADYLNSSNLVTLQACTLYVAMLRSHSRTQASWVLTGSVVRLGQAMNLHRDGDGNQFSAFEGEMRRRLWYFIAVLDVRGAEDRGSETILTSESYNTIRPTPIDDDNFGPDSAKPLVAKTTPAENVIALCVSRCIVFGQIIHPHDHPSEMSDKELTTEAELIQHVQSLERDFIHTADPSHLNSRYASEVARIVILKMWLIVQYPYTTQPSVAPMRVSRETMLRTAVSVMELSERMTQPPWENRFAWWTNSFVQWHPLAVALAELTVQTEGKLVERAWRIVEDIFPVLRDSIADSAQGPLWRPIRKLYRKAKAARSVPAMNNLTIKETQPQPSMPQQTPEIHGATPNTIPITTNAYAMTSAPFTETFDSMDMDPSFLFQYPTDFSTMSFDQPMSGNYNMTSWNEFITDTQMDQSSSSGGSV